MGSNKKMEHRKLLHATYITEHIYIYLCMNIHKHTAHLLNLSHSNCKQQQNDGDDNVVSIFTSKFSIRETLAVHSGGSRQILLGGAKMGPGFNQRGTLKTETHDV